MSTTKGKKAPATERSAGDKGRERDDQSRATGEGMREPPAKGASRTRWTAALLVGLSWAAAPALAAPAQQADITLLSEIHAINQAEIKISRLATQRYQSESAKSFALMLDQDHATNDHVLGALARQERIKISNSDGMVQKLQAHLDQAYDQLARTPESFDHAFAQTMLNGHQDALALVVQGIKDTHDAPIKQILSDLRPALEAHRDAAERLLSQTSAH